MSKYSDRHPHQAECAVKTCINPGTELKVQMGQLGWWCPDHADMELRNEKSA